MELEKGPNEALSLREKLWAFAAPGSDNIHNPKAR
jgi:hypothetical protein